MRSTWTERRKASPEATERAETAVSPLDKGEGSLVVTGPRCAVCSELWSVHVVSMGPTSIGETGELVVMAYYSVPARAPCHFRVLKAQLESEL
jgi:hypothetical protein